MIQTYNIALNEGSLKSRNPVFALEMIQTSSH